MPASGGSVIANVSLSQSPIERIRLRLHGQRVSANKASLGLNGCFQQLLVANGGNLPQAQGSGYVSDRGAGNTKRGHEKVGMWLPSHQVVGHQG